MSEWEKPPGQRITGGLILTLCLGDIIVVGDDVIRFASRKGKQIRLQVKTKDRKTPVERFHMKVEEVDDDSE